MDRRLLSLVQMVSMVMLAWFGFTLLARIHGILVVAVIVVAGGNVVVIWMLRFEPQRLARFCHRPSMQRYVNWVCRWTGDQLPLVPATAAVSLELLLKSDEDFRTAAERARQIVRGHDEVVDRILWRIRDAVTLRKRQLDRVTQPPLASFLLSGGDGIGKRYLARVIAKLLFRSSSVLVFDCDTVTPAVLFGANGTPGELLEAVRTQPWQLIIFEQVDAASPDLIRAMQPLLTRGTYRSADSGREISFQNTVIVLTTTRATSILNVLADKPLSERAWHDQAVEAIAADSHIAPAFLNAVTEILLCRQPSDRVKAEVTALLMLRECKAHGLTLTQADPLIIASEVVRIDDATGFSRLPQNVNRLLQKPLLAASQQNRRSLSLRVRLPQTLTVE